MKFIIIAVAPIILLALYINYRDKYEKEPWYMLLLAIVAGALTVLPILPVEQWLSLVGYRLHLNHYGDSAWNAFVVAAGTEEFFKYTATVLIFFFSKQFNEKFDGIVYAVFVSLGFALIENILYVVGNSSMQIGYMRAITAVPAHTLFGVSMGFYLGLAKFGKGSKALNLFLALLVPIILHGIYDYLIFIGRDWATWLFVGFLLFLWVLGLRRISKLSKASRFNPANIVNEDPNPEDPTIPTPGFQG
ncbi:MAG: PrsW family intramembrane metalloprotease [Bacteroidales bacterium]|nr:PrsW family intramembrane metalloprotease [Bacteroidales bacterium]